MGSDRTRRPHRRNRLDFNPRSPDGERLGPDAGEVQCLCISIHAPRMGSDPAVWVSIIATLLFQSTLPGWGATEATARTLRTGDISIHAPRMGSDKGS